MNLTTNPDVRGILDELRLLEFLEQHLGKENVEERERIDEMLYKKISDLAAYNEILTMVRSHRPRATQLDIAEIRRTKKGTAWRFTSKTAMKSELSGDMEKIMTERTLQEIPLPNYNLRTLLKTFMDQETPKDTSSRGWVIKDIAQRKALRGFWDELREQQRKRLKGASIRYDNPLLS
jgi:hypothetical protein